MAFVWTEIQPLGNINKNWAALRISADGTKMLATIINGRVYYSSNSGTDWSEIQPKGDANGAWWTAELSADGTKIFIADYGAQCYYSSDSGANFTTVTPISPYLNWYRSAMSYDGTCIAVAPYYGSLYYSSDSGSSWSDISPSGNSLYRWALSMSSDGMKLLSSSPFGSTDYVQYSGNRGATWTQFDPPGLGVEALYNLAMISPDGQRMIAGSSRLYISKDSGSSWAEIRPGGDANLTWMSGEFSADGLMFMVAHSAPTRAAFFSQDNGSTFETQSIAIGTPGNSTPNKYFDISFYADKAIATAANRLYTGPNSAITTTGPSFTGTPLSGRKNLRVDFTPTGTLPGDTFSWTFGDEGISYKRTPVHIYKIPGLYTVTLTTSNGGAEFSVTRTDYILVTGAPPVKTTLCHRYAVTPDQGVGMSRFTGSDMPFPETGFQPLLIHDANDHPRVLVLDASDGYFYDISTRDGPTGSGLVAYHKDKVAVAGTGGTDIAPAAIFPADEGTFKHYYLEHLESHAYLEPTKTANRGASGYDSNGFLSGLEVDFSVFVDGEQTTAKAQAEDIPLSGDVVFDKKVHGHKLQMKISANKADHVLTGRQQYYKAMDKSAAPDYRQSDTGIYQDTLSQPTLWPDIINGSLINRITGASISGTISVTDDPNSFDRAYTFTAALTLPSVALTGAGALLLWYTGTAPAITIGGVAVALTTHSTYGSWTLAYAGSLTASGAVVLTPSTTATIADLRFFNSAVSAAMRTYYYTDISSHDGVVCNPGA